MYTSLNMSNLRTVLNSIFFEGTDNLKYIVPLQGNWYTPTLEEADSTWIGYSIDTISTNTSIVPQEGGKYYTRSCKARIHLTFIGTSAEDFVHTMLFWSMRQDIDKLLDDNYKGKINYEEFKIYTSLYMQEGKNSQLCWNVDLEMSYNEVYIISDQNITLFNNIVLLGTLINKDN